MKKGKHDMHLPHYVNEGMGVTNRPRKFHFWHDIIPYCVYLVENKFNFRLHHGYKSSKIYKSNEGKKRLKTCFF